MHTPAQPGCFIYFLQCADGSLYCGATKSLPRRIQQHRAGKASRYTRSRLPVKLVYWENHQHWHEALKREYQLKQLTTKAKHKLIAKGYAKQVMKTINTVMPRALSVAEATQAGRAAAENLIKNFGKNPEPKQTLRKRLSRAEDLPPKISKP